MRISVAESIHLIWGVLAFLFLILSEDASTLSFRWPRAACAIMAGVILSGLVSTLLVCFFVGIGRKSQHPLRISVGRVPRLVLIAIVDFCVVVHVIGMLDRVSVGDREFWGENLHGAFCSEAQDLVGMDEANSFLAQQSLFGRPELYVSASWPHCCFGRFNAHEPGELYVKVYEPENDELLVESSRKWHQWSENPNEVFPFAFESRINKGRRSSVYVVRCDLWFSPGSHEEPRIVMRVYAKINGEY